MELEDYKDIISEYQQKCFELFNENVVLKCQIKNLNKKIELFEEKNNLKKSKDY